MSYAESIRQYNAGLGRLLTQFDADKIAAIAMRLNAAMKQESQIFIFGNGGCSALASHFCADLGKMMKLEKNENYRIISLNDNMPSITAWANDTGYENVFWRQLELFLEPGDVAFALSGSGNSENVIRAIQYASERGNHTLGLSGFGGGRLALMVATGYIVPSDNMQFVEDAFGVILHAIFACLRDS